MLAAAQLVEPAYCHIPPYDYTDGDQAADLAASAGYAPDGEQRLCLDAIFARDRRGRSVAFEILLAAARQNLKTGAEKQAALAWLFLFHEDPVVWTAHEWDTVGEAFHDLDELISGYSWLSRQVRYVHRGERDQEICTKHGARLLFKTRTPGGGRGLAGAKVIVDEAWKATDAHMGSLIPTLSARSMTGDPQVLYGSSAAHEESSVMHSLVARGRAAATDPARAGAEDQLVHLEWCAPPPAVACKRGDRCDHSRGTRGCGCDNPAYWLMANPAMNRRISEKYIRGERKSLAPEVFGRERMGWHDQPAGELKVIAMTDWEDEADPASEPLAPVSLAVVFSGDRKRAAIGLAGKREDGLWHVEVADCRQGTSWVLPRLKEMIVKHDPCAIVVDPLGHEKTIIPDLEIDIEVLKPTGSEVAAAFGLFYDAVTDSRSIRHRDQDDLTTALAGATTRDIGDAGTAWGRRKSGVDISPLVAVTLAMWGHLMRAPEMSGDATAFLV